MNKQFISALSLLIGLLLVSTSTGYADEIVTSGQVVNTDLNVYDDLDLEAGSIVDADVHVFGGDATIAGTINGNLVVFGGDVKLEDTAEIQGDCVIIAGDYRHDTGEVSPCTALAQTLNSPISDLADFDQFPDGADFAVEQGNGGFGRAIITSLLLGVLAFGTTIIAPSHINRIGDAVTVRPVASGTVGFLTFIASLSIITILAVLSALLTIVCVGLLGVPIVLALSAVLMLGMGIGWVAVGKVVGEVIRDALKLKSVSLPVTATVGTVALSLLIGLFGLLPAIGFGASIAAFIVGGIGLGATALTRFGTRAWPLFAVDDGKEEIVIRSLPDEINLL